MGIHDRDYMKRSSDDERRGASTEDNAEEFFSRFLQRNPRFFLYLTIGIVGLAILGIILAVVTR